MSPVLPSTQKDPVAEAAPAGKPDEVRGAAGTDESVVLRDVLEQFQDGLVLMDREWRFTFANETARKISRFKPQDLNGPTHWELFPYTVGTEVETRYRRVMEERVTEEFRFYYEPFEAHLRIRAFPAGEGMALQYRDETPLRTAEMSRDRALHELKQVLESTSDSITSFDREWRYTYVNGNATKLVGPAEDLIGQVLWNRFPHLVYHDSPYVKHYFAAMHQGISSEFVAFYPEPLHVWLRIEVKPSADGVIIFFRDITQQRADEEALRESEARYRVLTELGPQAIWTGAPDGRITYANQRFLEYLGSSFEVTDGPEWLDGFYEEDRTRVIEAWTHSVTTGEEYDIEARLHRGSDGAVRWWRLRALPLRDPAGTITMWMGVADEIHDRKVAADRLRREKAETERQRRELEAVYDTAPVGLALFEPREFRYLRVNQRQAEIVGRPVAEIVGQRMADVVTSTEVLDLFARVARGETVRGHSLEVEFRDRPGERRSFHVNYSPVKNDDGSVRAISAAVLETTQQQRAEAALRQSEKLAAVGRLASSISHEINNPLEAITNLLYLAATDTGLTEQGASYVKMAQDELGRVSQIATQTLRFHRQADRPTNVTAAQLVAPVLSLYAGRLMNSRVRVAAAYRSTRTILCFENDIRQVLNNLIANAIDAMRSGGQLCIRAHDAHDLRSGTPGVRIAVCDDGHGMSPATAQKVFEPFYTTKGMQGNGLGLWISQGIVERHQGQLRVRSSQRDEFHGTVFTLFLPSAEEPLPAS